MLRAKQRYFNNAVGGTFSSYDEKVLAEMTLYGLPMQVISMSNQTPTPPGDGVLASLNLNSMRTNAAQGQLFTFDYDAHVTPDARGTYYTLAGERDILITGGRPVQPRVSTPIDTVDDEIVHGVLWLGGSFTDWPNFDPVVSDIISEENSLLVESNYPIAEFYPLQIASINRFLSIDGTMRQRLVFAPGQFQADPSTTPTTGVQRLYDSLTVQIYTAPFSNTDFIAPQIWQVNAITTAVGIQFGVRVDDEESGIQRIVILYRQVDENEWSSVDLTYDNEQGWGMMEVIPTLGEIEYIAQAVDWAGNVSIAYDNGNAFKIVSPNGDIPFTYLYLPVIMK